MGSVKFTRLPFDANAKTVIVRSLYKLSWPTVQVKFNKLLDGYLATELAPDEPLLIVHSELYLC